MNESALEARLFELVEEDDGGVLTARSLRDKLEKEFSVDLSRQKEWIKSAARKHAFDLKKRKREAPPATMPALSVEMAELIGVERANRFEATRLVWQYIKRKKLQANNELVVECDESLRKVFGCTTLTSFGISKLVAKHIFDDREETVTISAPPEKNKLAEFCRAEGARDDASARDAFKVTKILWAYIKRNKLQDPEHKNRIVFDETLKDIFLSSESTCLNLSKMVAVRVGGQGDGVQSG